MTHTAHDGQATHDDFREPISEEVVLIGALLSDHGLDKHPEPFAVSASLRLYEVKKQVCARHILLPSIP